MAQKRKKISEQFQRIVFNGQPISSSFPPSTFVENNIDGQHWERTREKRVCFCSPTWRRWALFPPFFRENKGSQRSDLLCPEMGPSFFWRLHQILSLPFSKEEKNSLKAFKDILPLSFLLEKKWGNGGTFNPPLFWTNEKDTFTKCHKNFRWPAKNILFHSFKIFVFISKLFSIFWETSVWTQGEFRPVHLWEESFWGGSYTYTQWDRVTFVALAQQPGSSCKQRLELIKGGRWWVGGRVYFLSTPHVRFPGKKEIKKRGRLYCFTYMGNALFCLMDACRCSLKIWRRRQ